MLFKKATLMHPAVTVNKIYYIVLTTNTFELSMGLNNPEKIFLIE